MPADVSDTFTQLAELVAALDRRFPDHNGAFERVSRLSEESGELDGVRQPRRHSPRPPSG